MTPPITTTPLALDSLLLSLKGSGPFSGDAMQWLIDTLISAFGGQSMFGLLLAGVIFFVFYWASDGDFATPTVALILTGTVTVSMLPASYQRLSYVIVVIGLGAAVWQVLKTYVLNPT